MDEMKTGRLTEPESGAGKQTGRLPAPEEGVQSYKTGRLEAAESEGGDEEEPQLFPYTDWTDVGDVIERSVDPVPASKFLYIGQALTAEEFTSYVEGYNFGSNPPDFVVLHHTAIPYTLQFLQGSAANAWDANDQGLGDAAIKQKRLKKVNNMKEYYRTQLNWDRGPHLFIDERYIYLFTPMYEVGIHAAQGNSYRDQQGKMHYSIGIEVIGHYGKVKWPDATARLVGHAIAVLQRRLGTFELKHKVWAGGISSHRNYNKPACPGDAITEAYYVQVAKEGAARLQSAGSSTPASASTSTTPTSASISTAPASTGGSQTRPNIPASSRIKADSPLLGPATGTKEQLAQYLYKHLATDTEYKSYDVDTILGYYWKYASLGGLDPYLAVIHSIHETDGWRTASARRPRRNPANLGVTSESEGLSFDSWEKSVQAHVGHLLALALRDEECNDVQRALVHMNPNHAKITERGRVKQVKDLNGRWNSQTDYDSQLLGSAAKVELAK